MRPLAPVGLALAALVLTGCGDDPSTSAPRSEPAVDLPGNVAVFTPDDLDDEGALFDGEATWTPTAADVRRTDAALRGQVMRTEGIDIPYADHVRQMTGLADGVVLVNALCDGESFDWHDEWVTVNDGGACFWQAAVRDGTVVSFSVNGEA